MFSSVRSGAPKPASLDLLAHSHSSTRMQIQGGGNAANALTAAARLGLGSTLVTKVSL